VLRTYARPRECRREFGYLPEAEPSTSKTWKAKIDDLTAAVVVQSPNCLRNRDQVKTAAEIAHRRGALLIMVFTEAVSLGLIEPPADADIVAGELQSFAISPSYGGPFAGHHRHQGEVDAANARRLVARPPIPAATAPFCLTLSTASSTSGARRLPPTSAPTRAHRAHRRRSS